MSTKKPKVTVGVRLDPEVVEVLKRLSEKRGETVSGLVRSLLLAA